jgi:hypothetical protein
MLSTDIIRDVNKFNEYCIKSYQFTDELLNDEKKIICTIYNCLGRSIVWHDVHSTSSPWTRPDIMTLTSDQKIQYVVSRCLLQSSSVLNYICTELDIIIQSTLQDFRENTKIDFASSSLSLDMRRARRARMAGIIFENTNKDLKRTINSIRQSLISEAMVLIGHIQSSTIRREVFNKIVSHMQLEWDEELWSTSLRCDIYLTSDELEELRNLRGTQRPQLEANSPTQDDVV